MLMPELKFWEIFKKLEGALSTAESIAVYNCALQAPQGTYIELGSYKMKSAISAIAALKPSTFYAVDPEFLNEDFVNEITSKLYFGHMNVVYVGGYSTDILPQHKPYSWVFWDSGEHAGEVLQKEKEILEDAMIPGGIICSHDFNSQFTEQTEAMKYLVSTGKFEWIDIDWQPIFDYVKEHNLETGNNSWHVYPDLPHPPNFVGAVRRK